MTLGALPVTPSRSEQAYQAIMEAILSLQLRPGTFLSIGDLANQLEISRTPVRDALLWLQRDGLVTLVPQKGVYVSEISVKDIENIYELRIVLESYAARVATTKLTPDDLNKLEETINEAQQAFEQGDRVLASDFGRQIHDRLVQQVGNKRLTLYLNDLDIHYTRIRRFSVLIPGRFEKSHEEHQKILIALQSGDSKKAEQAMADHLSSVHKDILANAEAWTNFLENQE